MISSTLLYEITTQHPFVNGNKRTAIEVVKYFLELNNSFLNMSYNYLIYVSFNKLNRMIEKHIGEKDDEKRKIMRAILHPDGSITYREESWE